MNERIRNLREESVSTPPRFSRERALLVTQAYTLFEGKVSVPELRALTFRHILANKTLWIGKDELLVGEKGDTPQAAPAFPEICCHTVADLENMSRRELISFRVNDEDIRVQEETIIPFWENRQMRKRIFSLMTPEWKQCYQAGIFTEFMEQRGPGHTVGSSQLYEKGFLDRCCEIEAAIKALDYPNDPQAHKKHEQLTAMKICCEAIILLGERYAVYARELARTEEDGKRREELLQIAANCDVVPAHKPQTYWQALQMYWFIHIGVTLELNPWDAFSPGRLDQHLISFYDADLSSGILDETRAKELLSCLWIKFNNQPAPPKVGVTLKESGTYTDFTNINSGGVTSDGNDGVNAVSYLILDCMEELELTQPSSNVQVSKHTPQDFLHRAVEIARKGWGQPAFYNSEAIISELLNAGKSLTDARMGGASGCVETGAFGNEAYILTGYFNLPKILEITLNNGIDPNTGEQIGVKSGVAESFTTYDEVLTAYRRQIDYFATIKKTGSNVIEELYACFLPVPFLSVITNDCIEKGKDYNDGGARYNTSYIQGVGIGTACDSLAAIKYFLEHDLSAEKKSGVSLYKQLLAAMAANFSGYGDVWQKVRYDTPRYGNDDDAADDVMRDIFMMFYQSVCMDVSGNENMRGGEYRINMLPTTCHIYFGEVTGATANGRLSGKPLSEGISPSQGADVNGPTAALLSAAKMEQLLTGGTLLNQKFTPEAVAGERGIKALASLIRAYFEMDGHHLQFNIIKRETLRAAQANPDEYRDLIVRVAGYSDYFVNLGKELQDEIIARTEYDLI